MTQEDLTQLQQLEQLSMAFQMMIKNTTPQVRAALAHHGFTKTRRFSLQKHLYMLVGNIHQIRARLPK